MSIDNFSTNFTNLIDPRTVKCVIFPPYGNSTTTLYGNSGSVPAGFATAAPGTIFYNGSVGAGSIITNVHLLNPTSGTFAASDDYSYTVSLVGVTGPGSNSSITTSVTGDVVSFLGLGIPTPLPLYGTVIQQNSSLLVNLSGGPGTFQYQLPPNVMVSYLD